MRSVAIALLVQGTKNERKIVLKKEQDEEGRDRRRVLVIPRKESQQNGFPNGFPAQRLQGTKLKLSVSLSAGRYEEGGKACETTFSIRVTLLKPWNSFKLANLR